MYRLQPFLFLFLQRVAHINFVPKLPTRSQAAQAPWGAVWYVSPESGREEKVTGTCVAATWLQGDVFRNAKAVSRAGLKGKARRSLRSAVLKPCAGWVGWELFTGGVWAQRGCSGRRRRPSALGSSAVRRETLRKLSKCLHVKELVVVPAPLSGQQPWSSFAGRSCDKLGL